MHNIHLGSVDYLILVVYFAFVLGIGWALKRYMKTSLDFLLSGRSIPAWITGLAFLSANLGAQEVIGMAASGAKYGIMTSHFYWVGAIPAMVFIGIFMMPFYYGSQGPVRSRVSQAAVRRKDARVQRPLLRRHDRLLFRASPCTRWPGCSSRSSDSTTTFRIAVSAAIVLGYILLGGLTSAIYNEVLQFFMIVLGFAPLVFLGLKSVGGWDGLVHNLTAVATSPDQSRRQSLCPGRLDPILGPHEFPRRQPDGRGMVRDGVRTRLCPFVRLLVHGFPGGATGHGR